MTEPTEHQEQVAVCRYLRERGIPFFAVPNAGRRRGGRVMKSEGLTPGVADLIIMIPGGGLAIEMKRRSGGRVSPAQSEWGQLCSGVPGWEYHVCCGASEALKIISSRVDFS